MRHRPLPPSDAEGVNPEGLGPAQPRPRAQDTHRQSAREGEVPTPPPDDHSEMTDNLRRERSKDSTR
jgi:hypothetical protein